jgi:transcriptional regulator with XRE-family HTH domain
MNGDNGARLATPAERLAYLLKVKHRRRMTQTELARAMGVSPPFVSQLVAGQRKLTPPRAELAAAALGVSKAWLLHGEGDLEPQVTDMSAHIECVARLMALVDDAKQEEIASVVRAMVGAEIGGGSLT